MTRPATATDERTPARRKSTLFCWECDHASPIDGDWVRQLRDRHVEYNCPDCETTLAKRPLPDAPTSDRAADRVSVSWQRTLRTTVQIWRVSVDVGLAGLAAMASSRPTGGRRR